MLAPRPHSRVSAQRTHGIPLLLAAALSAAVAMAAPALAAPPPPRFSALTESIRFGLGALYPVDYQGASCEAVNLDGMNGLDIAGIDSAGVFILPNHGDGTFGTRTDVMMDMTVAAFALGDLDGDGVNDLVAVGLSGQDSVIEVRRGQPGGQFDPAVHYPLAFQPTDVAIAELSGDAHGDVLVASATSDSFRVFSNDGTGQLAPYASVAVRVGAYEIRTADFDANGTRDVALLHLARVRVWPPHGYTPPDSDLVSHLTILMNRTNGVLEPTQTIDRTPAIQDLATLDANLDGHTDIALIECGQVALLRGSGNGTFEQPQQVDTIGVADPGSRFSIACGDVDRDGFVDLVYCHSASSYFMERNYSVVLRGRGDGTFQTPITYRVPRDPERVLLSDLNGDGTLDLVTMARGQDFLDESPPGATVLLNHGDGRLVGTLERMFDPSKGLGADDELTLGGPLRGARVRPRVTPDLVLTRGGRTAVMLHEGDNMFSDPVDVGLGSLSGARDLDGDGLAELVLCHGDSTSVWRSLGDGQFSALGEYVGGVPIALEDLDGDGRPELGLLIGHQQLAMRRGVADGTFGALELLGVTFPTEAPNQNDPVPKTSAVTLADLDGDGLADVVATIRKSALAPNVDSLGVWFNLGAAQFAAATWYDLPSPSVNDIADPQRIDFGDVNGDRMKDIVVLHTADQDNEGHLSILLNSGARAFQRLAPIDDGNSPHDIAVADMNGDGFSDILTVNSNGFATFHFFVYENDGGSLVPLQGYRVADFSTNLTVADLDADGRPDVVTYGPRWGGSLVMMYNQSTRPVAVTLSRTAAPTVLAIAALSPNPSRGRASIALSLPTPGAVTIDVLDIAGRRVSSQRVAGLPAGGNVLRVAAPESPLRPGVYLVRIGHAGVSTAARFCVVN